jgi:hypothetical protein
MADANLSATHEETGATLGSRAQTYSGPVLTAIVLLLDLQMDPISIKT